GFGRLPRVAALLASNVHPSQGHGPRSRAAVPPRAGVRSLPGGFVPPPGGLQTRVSIPARAVSSGVRSPRRAGAASWHPPTAAAPRGPSVGGPPCPSRGRRPLWLATTEPKRSPLAFATVPPPCPGRAKLPSNHAST